MLSIAKRISSRVLITILIGVGLFAGQAWAGSITVLNNSFEDPAQSPAGMFANVCPTSWTCNTNTGFNRGVWYPTAASYPIGSNGLSGGLIVPDGNQVGYSDPGLTSGNFFAQNTAATIANNTIYTLDLWAGHPKGVGFPNGVIFQLTADGVAFLGGSVVDPGQGMWHEYTLPYHSLAVNPLAGKVLGIKLSDFPGPGINPPATSPEVNWDLITLRSDLDAAVPEPSSLLLLGSGMAGLGFWRRRQS